MRAFISLEPPQAVKKEIDEIQQKLKATGLQARWVKPEIAHLTLVFLGFIAPHKIKPIGRLLDEVASQIQPIKLHFLKIGCFPSPAKARVIFVNLGGELGKLNALVIKIRKQLKKENIWFDKKPFTAHITLSRLKKPQNLSQIIKKVKISKTEFFADKISFIKSTLTPSGPIYETMVK